MSKGLLFWILVILWLLFGFVGVSIIGPIYAPYGNSLLIFVLFVLLGWKVFGPPIQG